MTTLIIDNYDSFTFNLVQQVKRLCPGNEEVLVVRNDFLELAEVAKLLPSRIIISPGPSQPRKAGISEGVIRDFAGKVPILGVCLGHQAIATVFGGKVRESRSLGSAPRHGKQSKVYHGGSGVLAGIPSPFSVARYHSLLVDSDDLPEDLEITATTDCGEIMAIAHSRFPLWGVQFHPESFLTEYGDSLIRNYLNWSGK